MGPSCTNIEGFISVVTTRRAFQLTKQQELLPPRNNHPIMAGTVLGKRNRASESSTGKHHLSVCNVIALTNIVDQFQHLPSLHASNEEPRFTFTATTIFNPRTYTIIHTIALQNLLAEKMHRKPLIMCKTASQRGSVRWVVQGPLCLRAKQTAKREQPETMRRTKR